MKWTYLKGADNTRRPQLGKTLLGSSHSGQISILMADEQQELSDQIDELLTAIEKLCAQSEKAWGKASPQAQEMRTQQQTTQVLVDAVRQIEIDDAKIFPDKSE